MSNACLDELRRRNRRDARIVHAVVSYDGIEHTPSIEHANDAVVEHGTAIVNQIVIEAALKQLPEEFRSAVVLRDICDLDYAEIAYVLDIPPGTVRSRIARGRAALAAVLVGNQTTNAERPMND